MAKENIRDFFDAAMTDKTLAEKVAGLASGNGYDFTAEELLELGAQRPLPDEDMANVTGGGTSITVTKQQTLPKSQGII